MNYCYHYNQLIESRKILNRSKKDSYFENHHIIPKCLGGTDDKENLVLLTAREHYVAHWLLWKATKNSKLAYAFSSFASYTNEKRNLTAKQYERAKQFKSDSMKSKKISEETRQKMSNAKKGKKFSEEHKQNITKAKIGKKRGSHSEETKRKISEGNKGKKFSDEVRKNMSEGQKGKTLSKETREKIAESMRKYQENKNH